MNYWEFLLQKDGDTIWLPLEPPNVEILEGRYRVIARSAQPEISVQIQLTYQPDPQMALDGSPRVRRRRAQTNREGLVVVFPFTELTPGLWEMSCAHLQQTWATTHLQLQVLPLSDREGNTWEAPDFASELDRESAATAQATPSPGLEPALDPVERLLRLAEQLSEQVVTQSFDAMDQVLAASPDRPDDASQMALPAVAVSSLPQPVLSLDQTSYLAYRGETITLSGWVNRGGDLQISLRDPQSLESLLDLRQTLPNEPPPFPFTCSISIPGQFETQVLLGEVILHGDEATHPLSLSNSVSQTFTITCRIEELLQAISPDLEAAVFGLPPDPDPTSPRPASTIPELQETLQDAPLQGLGPAGLPPLLRFPSPQADSEVPRKGPELPSFGKPIAHLDWPLESAVGRVLAAESLSEITAEFSGAPSSEGVEPPPVPPEPLVAELLDEAIAAPASQPPDEPESEAVEVQDEPVAEALGPPPPDPLLAATPPPAPLPASRATDAALTANEFVVELPDWEARPAPGPIPPHLASSLLSALMTLPDTEPVPVPELELDVEELIAGSSVQVTVKLPELIPRIYIKLWLKDCQTRSLLDGPRCLIDFAADGQGRCQAVTQVAIPAGSLEISFEAVAVELRTQRESRKTVVDRKVLPPNLPAEPSASL